jgi:hypothetical protein
MSPPPDAAPSDPNNTKSAPRLAKSFVMIFLPAVRLGTHRGTTVAPRQHVKRAAPAVRMRVRRRRRPGAAPRGAPRHRRSPGFPPATPSAHGRPHSSKRSDRAPCGRPPPRMDGRTDGGCGCFAAVALRLHRRSPGQPHRSPPRKAPFRRNRRFPRGSRNLQRESSLLSPGSSLPERPRRVDPAGSTSP